MRHLLVTSIEEEPSAQAPHVQNLTTLAFTGVDIASVLALDPEARWRQSTQGRWWLTNASAPLWRWEYPVLNVDDGHVSDCEIGRDSQSGECATEHYCTIHCALAAQPRFNLEPTVCNKTGRVPRFAFTSGRAPFSLVDFAWTFHKPSVALVMLGDSTLRNVYNHALCHMARAPGVKVVFVGIEHLNYTGPADSADSHRLLTARSARFSLQRGGETRSLVVSYVEKMRPTFVHSDILALSCAHADFLMVNWGAHFEAERDGAASYEAAMAHALATLAPCRDTAVAFMLHPPHRFEGSRVGWWDATTRKPQKCALLPNATMAEADWITPRLARVVASSSSQRTLVPPLLPELVSCPRPARASPAAALYWIPQLDVLWDVYGFNFARAWKNVDCLHHVYFPDVFAHTYDAMTLAVLDHRHRCAAAPFRSSPHTGGANRRANFAVVDRGAWGFDDAVATVAVATPQAFVDRLVFVPLSMPRGPAWSRNTFARNWRHRLNSD